MTPFQTHEMWEGVNDRSKFSDALSRNIVRSSPENNTATQHIQSETDQQEWHDEFPVFG